MQRLRTRILPDLTSVIIGLLCDPLAMPDTVANSNRSHAPKVLTTAQTRESRNELAQSLLLQDKSIN